METRLIIHATKIWIRKAVSEFLDPPIYVYKDVGRIKL